MVKHIFPLVCVIASCCASAPAGAQPKAAAQLSSLKDLPKLGKMVGGVGVALESPTDKDPEAEADRREWLALNREFTLLRKVLAQARVEDRPAILKKLAEQTKWGTPERFVAYYISAWYGVDYKKSRDYLLNAIYWDEWQVNPESAARPFNIDTETGQELLYSLYEHNHDFELLFDVITTGGDAAVGEICAALSDEAVAKHPRGVLHTAELDPDFAYNLLHADPSDDNYDYPLFMTDEGARQKSFRAYVRKVASDPKDPLAPLAKDLLKVKPKSRR